MTGGAPAPAILDPKSRRPIPTGKNNKWWWAAKHASSDATMCCPARWIAMNAPKKAWTYMWAHAPASNSTSEARNHDSMAFWKW